MEHIHYFIYVCLLFFSFPFFYLLYSPEYIHTFMLYMMIIIRWSITLIFSLSLSTFQPKSRKVYILRVLLCVCVICQVNFSPFPSLSSSSFFLHFGIMFPKKKILFINLIPFIFFLPFSLPINVFSAYMQAHVWVVFICLQCVGSFIVLHVAIVSLVHVCTYKVTISCCGSVRPVYFDTLMVWSTLLRTRELTILGVIFSRPPHNLPNLNLNTWN